MSVQDYIAQRKSSFRRESIPKEIPEWLKNDWIAERGDAANILEIATKEDYAEYLLSRLKPRLPDIVIVLFDQGLIGVGELFDPTPNAYMEPVDREGYAIFFNSGLREFLYRIARILATRFISEQSPNQAEAPDISITARLIAEVFWWFEQTGRVFGPDYAIEPNQIRVASLLATEAEIFLLAHEIGHVIDHATEHNHPFFGKLSAIIPDLHKEEHSADMFGMMYALEMHNPSATRDPVRTSLVYAGIEFGLQIFAALEKIGFKFRETHPSAMSRLNFIRSEVQGICNDDNVWQTLSGLSKAIETLFSEMINILNDPQQHSEFYEREASQIIKDLEQLLRDCSGGAVPNYVKFYTGAADIFNKGYPKVILEKVANTYRDFTEISSKGIGDNKRDSWIRFQKFKLLLGFIMQANEPARSIFLRALGTSTDDLPDNLRS